MEEHTKQYLNIEQLAQMFFLLALVFVFFPVHYTWITPQSFQTGAYSDFTSISLYLSDIFLFLSFFCLIPRGKLTKVYKSIHYLPLLILFTIILLKQGSFNTQNWYFSIKYVELAFVAYGTANILFKKESFSRRFLNIFVLFSVLQSLLASFQFIGQKSLGLGKLGEMDLNPAILGLAKVSEAGIKLLRGYGTFPHPNLLSAFLVTAIFINLWLLVKSTSKFPKMLLSISIFLNVVGLTTAFSRASFLALLSGILIIILVFFYKKLKSFNLFASLFILLLSIALSFGLFRGSLLSRATVTDQASLERRFYARLGIQMVQDNPIFGIGIGESILHMQEYTNIKLWPWEVQPVHNYFLLAAAEVGILGAMALLAFFLLHVKQIIKVLFEKVLDIQSFEPYLLGIVVAFLVLMQFDHYFYTLHQTQMLLWIVLGLIGGITKTSVDNNRGLPL